MNRMEELYRRRPNRWGNLSINVFERDIRTLQQAAEHNTKELNQLIIKIAHMRNTLLNESDCVAEGHGMEDAIADPMAVLTYIENKIKRLTSL